MSLTYRSVVVNESHCGPEVVFETCVAMKFVEDDDDDESVKYAQVTSFISDHIIKHKERKTVKK